MSKKQQADKAKKRKEKLLGHSEKGRGSSKRGILIGGVVLFILGLAGGAIYYVNSIIPKTEEGFEAALIKEGPKAEHNENVDAQRRKDEAAMLNSINEEEDDTPLSLTEVGVSEETPTTTKIVGKNEKEPAVSVVSSPASAVAKKEPEKKNEEVKMTFYDELSSNKKSEPVQKKEIKQASAAQATEKVKKAVQKPTSPLKHETKKTTPQPKAKPKQKPKAKATIRPADTPVSPPSLRVKNPKYRLQVASYRLQKDALKHVKSLQAKGEDALSEEVDLGQKGVWFRVYVGGYANRATAKAVAKRFKQKYRKNTLIVHYK